MNKNISFFLILSIAILGVFLILLSMYVFDFFMPKLYVGMIMLLGFVLVLVSLILMKYYNQN
ncbi:MAG: hypothetical protein RR481_08595 [Longicatena sp.]